MTEVIDQLVVAMNAHDLASVARLIDENYRSEQPAHPGRTFVGRDQMLANWAAMFEGIPDFHAEVRCSAQDGDTTWTEWRWSGTRDGRQPFEMVGVTVFQVAHGRVVAGRLYFDEVERDLVSIEQVVTDVSGRRPEHRHGG